MWGDDPHRRVAYRGREHCDGQDGGRLPSPTGSSAPTSARTMLWQNASATMTPTATPAASRCQSRRRSARTVVAPSRRRQKAAKSCSPSSNVAAAFMAARSSGRGFQSVSCLRSGSAAAGRSQIR